MYTNSSIDEFLLYFYITSEIIHSLYQKFRRIFNYYYYQIMSKNCVKEHAYSTNTFNIKIPKAFYS